MSATQQDLDAALAWAVDRYGPEDDAANVGSGLVASLAAFRAAAREQALKTAAASIDEALRTWFGAGGVEGHAGRVNAHIGESTTLAGTRLAALPDAAGVEPGPAPTIPPSQDEVFAAVTLEREQWHAAGVAEGMERAAVICEGVDRFMEVTGSEVCTWNEGVGEGYASAKQHCSAAIRAAAAPETK